MTDCPHIHEQYAGLQPSNRLLASAARVPRSAHNSLGYLRTDSHRRRLFKGLKLVPVEGPEDEPALNTVEAGAQGARGAGMIFLKVPPSSKLRRIPRSFDGAQGARGAGFLKKLSTPASN